MNRINLNNYIKKDLKYKKLRIAISIGLSSAIATVIGFGYLGGIDTKIHLQNKKNEKIQSQIKEKSDLIKPISEYKTRLSSLINKINLINFINIKRLDSIKIINDLDKATPSQVSYSAINIDSVNNTIFLNGVSSSPFYVSKLLDNLDVYNNVFENPVLKSNTTSDQKVYNFEISAKINVNKLKQESGGEIWRINIFIQT